MRTLFLLLALTAPLRADEVDLTELFEDQRDQCDTEACHAFASVSLLEAALRRKARDSEPVYLSDADLFLQTRVINGAWAGPKRPNPILPVERVLVEGGWPEVDLRWALEHGVARRDSLPWGDFLRKFRDFRRDRLRDCAKAYIASGKNERACNDGSSPDFLAFEESLTPSRERRRAEELYFYGAAALRVDADREEVKNLLKGFTVHADAFNVMQSTAPWHCRPAGAPVKARLMEDLARRRPVIVCLTLDGLAEWGQQTAQHSRHCVAIRGYRGGKHVPFSLAVRNSWGQDGPRPDITEEQLCRIHSVVSVRP